MIENLWNLSQKIFYKRYFTPKISDLRQVLSLYNGTDWIKHIHASNNNIVNHGTYSKILLPYNIGRHNMYLVQWEKNIETAIHGHRENGCIFKVLKGSIAENIYSSEDLRFLKRYHHFPGSIKYIDNKIGYHKIINDNNHLSYSLHIY